MTESLSPPGLFDIYQPNFYQPVLQDQAAGRVLSLSEHLRALDQYIIAGSGDKGDLGEVMRVVAANTVMTSVVLFDIVARQQVGMGTLMMRGELHPKDRRPMFDSNIIVGSRFMRRGYASLILDYMKHYMAAYHEGGLWVLSSPQASPQHINASKNTVRNSGAERIRTDHATGYELWGQIVMPSVTPIPPSVSIEDLVFTHKRSGEVRALIAEKSEEEEEDTSTLLEQWQALRKSGHRVRVCAS